MRVLALLLLAAVLAGCAAPAAVSGDVRLRADGVRVSEGWAYSGEGVRLADGMARVAVNHRANTGVVNFTVLDGLSTWRLDWREFAQAPGKDFQDGGIVANLVEHGDSGVGDTSIPKVHLKTAGWGPANLYLNGRLVRDPSTGEDTLQAHFMWMQGRIRDERGVMWNLTKERPYNPDVPGDAFTQQEGDTLVVQVASVDKQSLFLVFEFRNVHVVGAS